MVSPADIRLNAAHLDFIDDTVLQSVINDVYAVFISPYPTLAPADAQDVIGKLLSQHLATLNVRRADSEGAVGLNKSLSVTRDLALDQTEYGQMARLLGRTYKFPWSKGSGADDDTEDTRLKAYVTIF